MRLRPTSTIPRVRTTESGAAVRGMRRLMRPCHKPEISTGSLNPHASLRRKARSLRAGRTTRCAKPGRVVMVGLGVPGRSMAGGSRPPSPIRRHEQPGAASSPPAPATQPQPAAPARESHPEARRRAGGPWPSAPERRYPRQAGGVKRTADGQPSGNRFENDEADRQHVQRDEREHCKRLPHWSSLPPSLRPTLAPFEGSS